MIVGYYKNYLYTTDKVSSEKKIKIKIKIMRSPSIWFYTSKPVRICQSGRTSIGGVTISILDHDAYTLVDPRATHSFASKLFLDRFQIETQPLEGSMRVSLPAGDPLIADRVVRDSRVLIEGQEFPADLVALDKRDFDVVLGMDWSSRHRATLDCYKKEVKLHRLGKIRGTVSK